MKNICAKASEPILTTNLSGGVCSLGVLREMEMRESNRQLLRERCLQRSTALGVEGATVQLSCMSQDRGGSWWPSRCPPKHLSQEPMFNISFLKLYVNPPAVHSPVSDQVWEC